MIARIVLAAAALAVVALLAVSRHGYDACQDARRDVIAAAIGAIPADRQDPAIAAVREHCRGAERLVEVAGLLYQQGRVDVAERLAREAVDAEPENALAWRALAATAAERDPATARQAARRQLELSPLDPPPVPAG
ncbi:MAG: tetratricopeptide repeat protein [Solirubrobacteraceae bacterium]|nr:tetratricopeptide repeat protein [Solirubrobacteraceae bacterium]